MIFVWKHFYEIFVIIQAFAIFFWESRPESKSKFVKIPKAIVFEQVFKFRKVNGKYVMEGESVVIDGEANVEYVPLCGKCYMEKVMGYNIEKLKKKFLHKKPNVFL